VTEPPQRGLLDTSTVILLGRLKAEQLPAELSISAITLAELSVGPLVAISEVERAARQAHLQLSMRQQLEHSAESRPLFARADESQPPVPTMRSLRQRLSQTSYHCSPATRATSPE
jgi:hypothetical protein